MYQVSPKKLRRNWEYFKLAKGHYPTTQAELSTCNTDAQTRMYVRLGEGLSAYKRRKEDGALSTADWFLANTKRKVVKCS